MVHGTRADLDRRAALGPTFDIRLSRGRAYVVRRSDDQPVAALSAAEAVTLALMNGERTDVELNRLLTSALGDRGRTLLDRVRSRFCGLLSATARRPGDPDIAVLARAADPDPAEGLRRLPGPRVLHWAVTQYCPRRCVYCFAEPLHGARALDSRVSRERLNEIWREARSLGADLLLAAGAEPLLRPDLPEVLGDAIRAGLTVVLTTKHPVSLSLARRFAAAGVPHLSFSLDTLDPLENRRLIGTARYAEQIRASARNLTAAGVAFSLQAVVSRLNPHSLAGVAAFAAAEGARVLQVVPFKPVRVTIGGYSNAQMLLEEEASLDSLIPGLQSRHPRLRIEKFVEPGSNGTGYHCDIGQTKLFFGPAGVVHRCYKLTHDATLRGADLREVSVGAAWHDRSFGRIISPDRESYAGSGCADCGRFDACHDDGRCIYEALVARGRYTAPDRACGGPFPPMVIPLRLVPTPGQQGATA
jgi:pyrroloquinoline quinone biosynthesis protein E